MVKKISLVVVGLLAMLTGMWVANRPQAEIIFIDGNTARWSDFQGQTVVVNYFAEWCAPCLKEVPELNAFASNLPANTRFLAVSWDELDRPQLTAIAEKYSMTFDLAMLTPEAKLPFTKPDKLPATFVLNTQGQLADTLWGEQTEQSLRAAIVDSAR